MERRVASQVALRSTTRDARELLVTDAPSVLGAGTSHGDGSRRVTLTLVLEVAAAVVSHEVEVELGDVDASADRVVLPLRWRATANARVLPSFEGLLEIVRAKHGSVLRVEGTYRVPLGPLGAFGDGLIGHRLARRTVAHLVEHLASRIDAEVDSRRSRETRWC